MISISIVEDDIDFCELLVRALSKGQNIWIASRHESAEEALKEIPLRCPDVVLMDIKLPGMSGIECLRRLRGSHPPLKPLVLILTEYEEAAALVVEKILVHLQPDVPERVGRVVGVGDLLRPDNALGGVIKLDINVIINFLLPVSVPRRA